MVQSLPPRRNLLHPLPNPRNGSDTQPLTKQKTTTNILRLKQSHILIALLLLVMLFTSLSTYLITTAAHSEAPMASLPIIQEKNKLATGTRHTAHEEDLPLTTQSLSQNLVTRLRGVTLMKYIQRGYGVTNYVMFRLFTLRRHGRQRK